jgi:hypothetical protein
LRRVEQVISQSNGCDIDLTFDSSSLRGMTYPGEIEPNRLGRIINTLIPSANRWRSLSIRGNKSFFEAWLTHQGQMPIFSRLLSLKISPREDAVDLTHFGFNIRCPNLRAAFLIGYSSNTPLPINPDFLSQTEFLQVHGRRPTWFNQTQAHFSQLKFLCYGTPRWRIAGAPRVVSPIAASAQTPLSFLYLEATHNEISEILGILPISQLD